MTQPSHRYTAPLHGNTASPSQELTAVAPSNAATRSIDSIGIVAQRCCCNDSTAVARASHGECGSSHARFRSALRTAPHRTAASPAALGAWAWRAGAGYMAILRYTGPYRDQGVSLKKGAPERERGGVGGGQVRAGCCGSMACWWACCSGSVACWWACCCGSVACWWACLHEVVHD